MEGRYSVKSEKVKCPFCPKEMLARGLGGHVRMKHKLQLTKVTDTIIEHVKVPVNTGKKKLTKVTDTPSLSTSPKSDSPKSELIKVTQIIERVSSYSTWKSDYTPSTMDCDHCKKVDGSQKIEYQVGQTMYYLCSTCYNDKNVIKQLNKKTFEKGGMVHPVHLSQTFLSSLNSFERKVYNHVLKIEKYNKENGVLLLPDWTESEMKVLKKLGKTHLH